MRDSNFNIMLKMMSDYEFILIILKETNEMDIIS